MRHIAATLILGLVAFQAGCATHAHRHELDQHGHVFYLDGAGGGGITSWGGGLLDGLRRAGYKGDFENHPWQTGLGVLADQSASVEYKQGHGRAVAAEIKRYIDTHPGKPAYLVGLSAGTVVATYALEALPPGYAVDEAVFLGSSLSAHHDMTRALQHVRGKLYVFTSPNDVVLTELLPLASTADREFCGACAVGTRGLHLPHGATQQQRQLYARIENIGWRPEFRAAGNAGGHTDAVNPAFVRQHIAPLLLSSGPRFLDAGVDHPEAAELQGAGG